MDDLLFNELGYSAPFELLLDTMFTVDWYRTMPCITGFSKLENAICRLVKTSIAYTRYRLKRFPHDHIFKLLVKPHSIAVFWVSVHPYHIHIPCSLNYPYAMS